MTALLLAALLGCAPDDGASSLAAAEAAPPGVLTVTPDPAVGSSIAITLTGATPGADYTFLVGNGGVRPGSCPPILGGACLGIAPGPLGYRVLGRGVVDGTGGASFVATIPAQVRPGLYDFQAVLTAPQVELSNPVEVRIQPACADAAEPNDDRASAATLSASEAGLSVCTVADLDWYAVEVPAGSVVSLLASFDAADGDLDLELYSAAGVRIDGSYRLTAPEEVMWFNGAAAPVTVYLQTYAVSDPQGDGVAYDLELEVISPAVCVDDPLEGDDDLASAAPLTAGTTTGHTACDADADWFWIDVAANDQLIVTAEEPANDGDVSVALYDAAGAPLTPLGDTAGLVFSAAQRVFVEVSLTSDDIYGLGNTYDLVVEQSQVAVCGADALEPNDSFGAATPITPGTWAGLEQCADADWYAIQAQAGEQIDVDMTFAVADGDIDAVVYDANNRVVGGGAAGGDNERFSVQVRATGTYYLRVYLYADYGPPLVDGAEYDLDLTVAVPPAVCGADVVEPNDTPQQPTPVSVGLWQGLEQCADADWYVITANAGQTIDVTSLFLFADGDIDMDLYDANQTQLGHGGAVTDNENITVVAPVTGAYLLKVFLYADNGGAIAGGAAYDLDVDVR
jgi:hypothetical protein